MWQKWADVTQGHVASPGPGDFAQMVAVLRKVLEERQPCAPEQCDERSALEGALRLATEHLHRALPDGGQGLSSLQEAARLADPAAFSIPASHRARGGKLVTSAKRAFVNGLEPFHIEMLRPQGNFNRALVRVLEYLTVHRALGLRDDVSSWAVAQLEPLAVPTRWVVGSHRGRVAGALVGFAKRGYLYTLGPVLEAVLQGQARWNLAMVEAIRAAAGAQAPGEAEARRHVADVEALREPLAGRTLPGALRVTQPLWGEVLRRQSRFNAESVLALANLLGTRTAPPQPPSLADYPAWCAAREPARVTAAQEAVARLSRRPLISLVTPVHDASEAFLRECLASVTSQVYADWEWILVDDASTAPHLARILQEAAEQEPRIRVLTASSQGDRARATNEGLAACRGDFVGFLGAEDTLSPHALAEVALAFLAQPELALLYTDEDGLDAQGHRCAPFFKPDWSPDLLRSVDYVRHFLVVRRETLAQVGGLREGFDGAQGFDLMLRLSEASSSIGHVTEPLYHAREGSAASASRGAGLDTATKAGVRALSEHLARQGESAEVTSPAPMQYRVRYPVRGTPKVSIIVPFKDRPDLLRTLVDSLLAQTRYPHFEVLLVSNNSTRPETFALLEQWVDPRLVKLTWDHPFNYPAINNWAAKQASGELLLFLNNDMEVVDPCWLDELVSQAQRPEVGAVGCKLLFPEGTVQHAGVVVGMTGFAGHPFWRLPEGPISTPFGHTEWTRNWLSVTSACVILRREVFQALGGFDERFQVCGSDVELGLRLNAKGLRVVCTAQTRLIHHESASRRADAIPEADYWLSYAAYRPWLGPKGDPYYNPHLTLTATDCGLRRHPEDGEQLAVRTLGRDVPSARDVRGEQRARAQRHLIGHLAAWDFTSEQAQTSRESAPGALAALRAKGRVETATWFVPAFGHVYAGIHTIFRFADLMQRRHGVRSDFVIYDQPNVRPGDIEARVAAICPGAVGAVRVLRRPEDVALLPACDLALATAWTSAYRVLHHPRAGVRGYFVQDYEPLFHAAGTPSALAEQTYGLGFYGIFNTPGLYEHVVGLHGMEGAWFEPAVDGTLFHPRRPPRQGPVRVFFYGRPGNERNGFELGLAALAQLKRELGPAVEVLAAGAEWDPEAYGVRGLVTNLGMLPAERTGALYRECDVGLCFMFTRHPSYLPLEMMACGVTVVTNDNPTNRWLLTHGDNCLLAEPTPSGVLARLRDAVSNGALRARLGANAAERVSRTSWEAEVDRVMKGLLNTGAHPAATLDDRASSLEHAS
ncbi:O-antigen biosynthesis protein RfbC [Myxococcus sp. NMCA1]|uniref:O-antigen biosynthesis protein RfbC n=1 Tax=Myxococcus sp. NMCA1 TaxID=2996785 RepID=UPI002286AAFC|nr:O-antigen biosynthesis protein RfbC [Myxococcus sp. NMCA1]WAM23590.1 O-antigen biosynthesis protein RfbC [Myxococcus sp. NMCA1]